MGIFFLISHKFSHFGIFHSCFARKFIADFFSRRYIRSDQQITVFQLVIFTEDQISEKLFKKTPVSVP